MLLSYPTQLKHNIAITPQVKANYHCSPFFFLRIFHMTTIMYSYNVKKNCWKTYFETSLEDFFGLGTSDSAVDSNLFITPNAKRSHSVTSLREHGLLASQLFQHLETIKLSKTVQLHTPTYILTYMLNHWNPLFHHNIKISTFTILKTLDIYSYCFHTACTKH